MFNVVQITWLNLASILCCVMLLCNVFDNDRDLIQLFVTQKIISKEVFMYLTIKTAIQKYNCDHPAQNLHVSHLRHLSMW